jgi:forkhead box protein J2/3
MPGMPIPMAPDESIELDENGQVNWRLAWLKEIGHLQQVTSEQEKNGADQEWYRMMLFRIRTALMPPGPLLNADGTIMQMPPHLVPPNGEQSPQPAQ